jgi:hypothetical protein
MLRTLDDVDDIQAERVLQKLLKEKEIKDQGIRRNYTPVSREMKQILKKDKFEKPYFGDPDFRAKNIKFKNQVHWFNEIIGYTPTHPDVLAVLQNVLFEALGDPVNFDIANLYYDQGMTYSDIAYFLKDTPGDFNLAKIDEIMSEVKRKLANFHRKEELSKTLGIRVTDNTWVWN